MKLEQAAKQLAQLGHPSRLSIYRLLIRAGRTGLVVGDIAKHLSIPNSTLTHHLGKMMDAGLLVQQKHKQSRICIAQVDNFKQLITFLQHDCCADSNESC